jgi:hypothetical protein
VRRDRNRSLGRRERCAHQQKQRKGTADHAHARPLKTANGHCSNSLWIRNCCVETSRAPMCFAAPTSAMTRGFGVATRAGQRPRLAQLHA